MTTTKKNYRNDLLLIAAFLCVGAVLAAVLFFGSEQGNTVRIRVDGTVVKEFPLNRDAEYTIQGVGGGTNHLVIENGAAYLDEASCLDCLCVHMGKIRNVGQSVVCLPNRVVVEITGQTDGQEPEVDVQAG